MDYGEIINSAFRLSWRYKSLWVFGLFAFGLTFPSMDWQEQFRLHEPFGMEGFDWDQMWPAVLTVVGLGILLMIIVHLLANAVSTPALVDAVNRLTRGGEYRFKVSFRVGVQYMWRTLALMILSALAIIVPLAVLVGIGIIAFVVSVAIGILSLLFLIPIFIVIIFVVMTIFNLAFRSIVVRDCTISEGLGEGIELLKRRPGPCLVMALIYVGLAIVIGIAATMVGVVIAIPFIAIAATSTAGMVLAMLIGFPVFYVVMLPISGFLGTVFEAMYTIFYFRLFEPPAQQQWAQPTPGATA